MGVPIVCASTASSRIENELDPRYVLSEFFATANPSAREHVSVYVQEKFPGTNIDILFMTRTPLGRIAVFRESNTDDIRMYSSSSAAVAFEMRDMVITIIELVNDCDVAGCDKAALYVCGGGNQTSSMGIRANKCTQHCASGSIDPSGGTLPPEGYNDMLFHAPALETCECEDCTTAPEMSTGHYTCDMTACRDKQAAGNICYHVADVCRAHGVAHGAHVWLNVSNN